MRSKPILDLLDWYSHDESRAAALAEFRRLVGEEPACLTDDDLLALEELYVRQLQTSFETLTSSWMESLGVAELLRDAAREELVRRDQMLQEAAPADSVDVRRVVGSVLALTVRTPADEQPTARSAAWLWWLAGKPLDGCSLDDLVGLASLPGTNPGSGPVFHSARAELLRRGFRPPHRADDVGEVFSCLGIPPDYSQSIFVSDRRLTVAGHSISTTELQGFEIQHLWPISLPALGDLILALGLLPIYWQVFLVCFFAERRGYGLSDERAGVLCIPAFFGFIGLALYLDLPLWLALGYPVLWTCLGCLPFSSGGDSHLWASRRHRLTIRTRTGEVHTATLMNEPIDVIRQQFARLIEEANFPPADCTGGREP
jgi:hypothetical protein